ncbi:T9SS type A sorting domain-containing protein [Lutibacter sp.]
MKENYFFLVMFLMTTFCYTQTIFINEIHYDNTGADVDEGVEIAGPSGTDLSGYKVHLYNGSDSIEYATAITLSGIIPNQQNNRGTLWFSQSGMQNGAPDGLALVDNLGVVIQFLSYEGVITAIDGPAIGLTSEDIGVNEPGAVGESLQLVGTGNVYTDFTWVGPTTASPGALNSNQTLSVVKNKIEGFVLFPNPVTEGKLYMISSNNVTKQVQIYTMLGQQVYLSSVQINEVIDVSSLKKGIYMLHIEEEGKIATRKLVIN